MIPVANIIIGIVAPIGFVALVWLLLGIGMNGGDYEFAKPLLVTFAICWVVLLLLGVK